MELQDGFSDVSGIIFCSKCGTQGEVESRFCSKCGTPLAGSVFAASGVRAGLRTLVQSINTNIDKVAIASVVVAVLGIFYGGVYAGLAAIGLGFYAKRSIEKGRGTRRKLAITGIWLGIVVSVMTLYYAGYSAGVNDGYTTGMQAGMQAGRTEGEQETWDSIGSAIGSLFGL